MEKFIKKRLAELRQEYSKGEKELEKAQKSVETIHDSMLRIHGAITVLEESLQHGQEGNEA